jgi:hypothetical protein
MILLCILAILSLTIIVYSAPIDPANERMRWSNTPDSRGTLTIIFSCGATMIICVWTGIHLNIDPRSNNKAKSVDALPKFFGKATWAIIALLAPDIVLSIALHQFLVALEYWRAVNEIGRNLNGLLEKSFPLKMAFYATMGGFYEQSMMNSGPQWRSLEFGALLDPNTLSFVYDYPYTLINDKSKASGLAKTITCLQTAWIVLQCLGRYRAQLHITLLELTTSVHALIAIIMFGIWWRKPLDVDVSIPIDRWRRTVDTGRVDNSITDAYIGMVKKVMKDAKDRIYQFTWALEQNSVILDAQPERHCYSDILDDPFKEFCTKTMMSVAYLKSINSVPWDASQTCKLFVEEIREITDYSETFNGCHDLPLTPETAEAAYQTAFSVARNTAFRRTGEAVMNAIEDANSVFSNDTINRETTVANYSNKLKQDLSENLNKIMDETAKHAAKAYKTVYHAASLAPHSDPPRKIWGPLRPRTYNRPATIHHEELQAINPQNLSITNIDRLNNTPGSTAEK